MSDAFRVMIGLGQLGRNKTVNPKVTVKEIEARDAAVEVLADYLTPEILNAIRDDNASVEVALEFFEKNSISKASTQTYVPGIFKTPERIKIIEELVGDRKKIPYEELFLEFQVLAQPHLRFSFKYAFKAALKNYILKGRTSLQMEDDGLVSPSFSAALTGQVQAGYIMSKEKGFIRKELITKILRTLNTKKGNMRVLTLYNKFQEEVVSEDLGFKTYNDFRQALTRYSASGTHFDITIGKGPESWIYIKSIKA